MWACCLGVVLAGLLNAAPAAAVLPSVAVDVTTSALADLGLHRAVTVSAACAAGSRLVGGGGYLRRAADPAAVPTNGLVLGGTTASTGASPVDLPAPDATVDPASWFSIAGYSGTSEAGNQASTFALCTTGGGPSHTVVEAVSRTGENATQEAEAPAVTTATCPAGSRLIGGGATTSTPDQVNDGVTEGNTGNLDPAGSYPSGATGVPAVDGSTSATSWSAFGSASGPTAQDAVTAYALCSSDPATPAVQVEHTEVDGPDAQAPATVTTASATCPAGTRMLGGGYRLTETVTGTGSGLQPQQGFHLRGSYPSTGTGTPPAAIADNATNPATWTVLQQSGGQPLGSGNHVSTDAYALCVSEPPPSADVSIALADAPDPVTVGDALTYTLTIANAGPSPAANVAVTHTLPAGVSFTSASTSDCTHATGTVTCALGTLASGAGETVTIEVAVDAAGLLSSTASITSDTDDPDPADNAASQTTTVASASQTVPTLTAQTASEATLGAPIADTATLAGGASPTGTITFELFGPGDAACATPIASSTATVTGNGSYSSAPHTTSAAGTYRWIARYGGDAANAPVATDCAAAGQAVSVTAAPTLTAQTAPEATLGAPIAATATLAGGAAPTGTITFELFGPGDAGCATPIASSTASVAGNGSYTSAPHTPSAPGTYRWIARYGGDAANAPAATACAAAGQAVSVKAAPTLTTQASPDTTTGGRLTATAVLASGSAPTGTITFRVYGPGDDTCATPLRTTTIPVNGNGTYSAPAFGPSTVGTYRWVAEYGGDASNRSAGPTACTAEDAAAGVTAPVALVALTPLTPTPPPPPEPPVEPPAAPAAAPLNDFSVIRARTDSRGRLVLRLRSSAAGRFTAVGTARRGRATWRFGTASANALGATPLTLTISPGLRSRVQLRRHRLRVRAVITFTPTGGQPRERSLTRIVKRAQLR